MLPHDYLEAMESLLPQAVAPETFSAACVAAVGPRTRWSLV